MYGGLTWLLTWIEMKRCVFGVLRRKDHWHQTPMIDVQTIWGIYHKVNHKEKQWHGKN